MADHGNGESIILMAKIKLYWPIFRDELQAHCEGCNSITVYIGIQSYGVTLVLFKNWMTVVDVREVESE